MLTLGPSVSQFFASNYTFPEGEKKGQPFITEPWQDEILDLVYEVTEDGERLWRFIVIGIPRGNGKSPLAAGIGDYELVARDDSPQVFCCAASREQAGIVHRFAYDMPKDGPLEDYIAFPRVRDALGPLKCDYNDGILRVLSADGDLQHGRNPSVVIEDELHSFKTGKQIELHTAMTTALHKRSDSIMVIITTAGANKASLLGDLFDAMIETSELEYRHDKCMMIARDYAAKSLLIWYGAPEDADVTDPKVWRACNPAGWITDEALLLAARREPESNFRRLYLNQWVVGESAAIQPAAWDACFTKGAVPRGSELWVAVDIGEHRDSAAIGWCCQRPNGRARIGARIIRPEGPESFKSTMPAVEAALREMAETYYLRQVSFDPWQMRDMANRLQADGMPMLEFPQNDSQMVPACQTFLDLLHDQTLVHDGDLALRAHALGAALKLTARGGWRFAKPETAGGRRDQSVKIDGLVAVTMAVASWAEWRDFGEPWTFTM